MKGLKISKGEWLINQIKGYPRFDQLPKITLNGGLIAQLGGGELEEVENNAILIADAGNTAQECDMLPSQLLKQRDYLLDNMVIIYLSLQVKANEGIEEALKTENIRAMLRNSISSCTTKFDQQGVQDIFELVAYRIKKGEITFYEGLEMIKTK